MSDYLGGLNPAQREAVMHSEGPLLVLAGPGSGKTRVITCRVAHLVEHLGVPADRILAVTFTNKAAAEMRQRLAGLLGPGDVWACTFHSFCARLLRRYGERVGRTSRFSILDQADRHQVLAAVMKEVGVDSTLISAEGIGRRISQLKNDLVGAEEFSQRAAGIEDRLVAQVYPHYQQRLGELDSVDFDDLLYLVAQLLRTDQALRRQLDERFQHVLVDEYQDTNLAQYAIARALSVDWPNLCATGDPDQSIYSWRGADLSNILEFEEDFPGAAVIRIEQNYRSTGHIVAVADELIRNNTQRKPKNLVTDNPMGRRVVMRRFQDEMAEASGIAARIAQDVDAGRRCWKDFAVFVRANYLTHPLETTFRAHGIPYQLVGGSSFFERQEIRDVLAYARLTVNPRDDAALLRVLNRPPRGIGRTTLDRLVQHARSQGVPLSHVCRSAEPAPGIRPRQWTAVARLGRLLAELAQAAGLPAAEAIRFLLDRTGYLDLIEHEDEAQRAERLGMLADLVSAAQRFGEEHPGAELIGFIEALCLVTTGDERDGAADVVTVMTLHAAKGLEFPVVFMVAVEADILPHKRAVDERNIEEERRLAFVGVTRAQEELLLSYADRRRCQGQVVHSAPSPFLLELPPESVERLDQAAWNVEDSSQEPGYEEAAIQVVHGGGPPSPADRFRCGMQVEHPRYGAGRILDLEGAGRDRRATIAFESGGTRRFVLANAPIEPALSEES